MAPRSAFWLRRLLRVRLATAALACLPALFVVAWYGWSAFAQLDRYRRAAEQPVHITPALLQLFLHDELHRSLRRLSLPPRTKGSRLPTFEIALTRAQLDKLNRSPVRDGKSSYVAAVLRKEGQLYSGRVRYRGRKYWNRIGEQKSLKVRLDTGQLVDGVRVFNLVNEVSPFGLEEIVVAELAREQGLLTPDIRPVWVRLNNTDMGVYRYETQPTEGLLRRALRMPGSIYSGNAAAKGPLEGLGPLFSGTEGWRKAAWRIEGERHDLSELRRLLEAVCCHSHAEFRTFVRHELDLDKLIIFDALDVVFGGEQHDFLSNHKLYFDASRGRFEPIAWRHKGFTSDPAFNLAENPLLLRLKALPSFLWRRDRAVYRLLNGAASPARVRERVDRLFARLQPELEADPYWDAYKLLPRATPFLRSMVRPMSRSRWMLSREAELEKYADRAHFLLTRLNESGLRVTGRRGGRLVYLDLAVSGHAAYRLRSLRLEGAEPARTELFADVDGNGQLDPGRDVRVATARGHRTLRPEKLYHFVPGIELEAKADRRHAPVRARRVGRRYGYLIRAAPSLPASLFVELEQLVTGATVRLEVTIAAAAPPRPKRHAVPSTHVPTLNAGDRAPHPWMFPAEPLPRRIQLGPGRIRFEATTVYAPHEEVRVAAGTRLELGEGVSMVFLGPVHFLGRPESPIEISGTPSSFGGLLLLGPGANGSRLRHLHIRGGSRVAYRAVYAPGVLNVQDCADITLDNVTLSHAEVADDLLHATYVERLLLRDITLVRAPLDGIDIELSDAVIQGARVLGAGDECLDLMGSRVTLSDSLLSACGGNGISAGEETTLTGQRVAVLDSKVGALAKNASHIRLGRSLVHGAGTALRTNRRAVYYDTPSSIETEQVFVAACDRSTRRARKTRLDDTSLRRGLPREDDLTHLKTQVLRLASWRELDRVGANQP